MYLLCFRSLPNNCPDDGVHGGLTDPVHGGEEYQGKAGQFEADIDGESGHIFENPWSNTLF